MQIIRGSRKNHYLNSVNIFLIVAALIAGMVGCNGGSVESFNLTISSTDGGNVTTPGKGTFNYDEGTMVDLTAEAEEGYRFVEWTGNVSTIADVNAASTNIIMNNNYEITAEFVRQYNLSINSTDGGNVTTPGEDTFTYDEGTVVDLMAAAEEGYSFIRWAGDVGTIAGVYADTTTIIMNNDYHITANFALKIWVSDWYDLDTIRDDLYRTYILTNDLDSTTAGYDELAGPTANEGKGWEPIGGVEYGGFIGTFDGQGYEIRDLFVNRHESGVGLFGYVKTAGIIENIGVDATVTGYTEVGALAGKCRGTVSNCYAMGNVAGYENVGGLVGGTWKAVLSNSYFTGSINGDEWVGGLVGGAIWDASNSFYNYNEVLINGENIITIGALFGEDFDEWLANDKFLDVNDRLSQESGYYMISDVDDFKQLLAFGQNDSLKFRLMNDINLATEPDFYIPYFSGEFDGNSHKISNLSFNFDFISQVGLFGHLAPEGTVTDLGVENASITGASLIGGLAGVNMGKVSNLYSTCNIIGDSDAGGLVGSNRGTVSNSYSTGSVIGTVGYLSTYIGGLVGWNQFEGTVSSSYATSSVTGYRCIGGLAGKCSGTVSNSYSSSNVTGESSVGGLVGTHGSLPMSDSCSTGSVTGNEDIGGLVGIKFGDAAVSNSYSACSVTGYVDVGGLVGDNCYVGSVVNCFWDTETSGQVTSAGGTGKTTVEMQDIDTFTDTETEGLDEPWDITTVAGPGTRNPAYIWNIVNSVTYPFLSWQS